MKKLPIILTSFCASLVWCPSSQAAEVESGLPFYQNHAYVNLFDFDDYDARMAAMDEQDIIDQKKINELYAPLDDDFLDEDLRQAFALSMMPQPEVNDVIPQEVLEASIRTAQREENQRNLNAVHDVVQDPPVVVSQPVEEWEPSSGDLVRSGEFVMDLKRSKNGVKPTHAEMANHLVVNMGVTAAQAEKILEDLGL